jgi:hypothetical protein
MEAAATPLRHPRITVLANRVLVDGLAIDDPTVVELVRARLEAGDDPAVVVADALEIGARVLNREQTGANVEFVKAELEKTAREVQGEFAERSRAVAEVFDRKFDEAFGPEKGHVARVLTKHFGDESSVAVQNQLKAALAEAMGVMRDDLRKQFTADSDDNPFAVFQRAWLGAMKQTSDQQHARLREMSERMQGLVVELERARAEKEKAEAVAQEAERGTAKGRSFEEAVYAALDEIAVRQGDDCDAVGDVKGGTGKTGDVVVAIEGCTGPARGRVVFEAKASRLSKPKAIEELDRARAERQADFAVLVVPDEERIPAKMHQLREYGGDKLVACFDPDEGSTLSLEVAYSLARARVLMARGEAEGIDAAAIREAIERASGAMGDVLRIKQQMTSAKTSIDRSTEILDAMAAGVRAQLMHVELLLAAPGEESAGGEGSPSDAAPPEAAARGAEPAPEVALRGGEPAPRTAAALAAGPRPRAVREPEPPYPGAERLPF